LIAEFTDEVQHDLFVDSETLKSRLEFWRHGSEFKRVSGNGDPQYPGLLVGIVSHFYEMQLPNSMMNPRRPMLVINQEPYRNSLTRVPWRS
jgi:hypothetical protein